MLFTRQAHNITSDQNKIPHIRINGKVQNEIGRIISYCVDVSNLIAKDVIF